MPDFWFLLVAFLSRLVAGMSAALLLVSPEEAEGRFFRNKLVIMLGLLTVALLATAAGGGRAVPLATGSTVRPGLLSAAALAYVGSVLWMLGRARWGRILLAALLLLAGYLTVVVGPAAGVGHAAWRVADPLSSALLLGAVLVAMLLGHWYLNAPGMSLRPIRRLVAATFGWLLMRAVVTGLAWSVVGGGSVDVPVAFHILRWTAGLLLPLILCVMVWWTLKVPNTQSATGILYAMVVLVFIGELVALMLVRLPVD